MSQPNDTLERKADRVSEEVMMPSNSTPLSTFGFNEIENDFNSHKSPARCGAKACPAPGTQIGQLRGKGTPLPENDRLFFESRFGHDFSHVRIHDDEQSDAAAQAVNARAFTFGRDIAFSAGEYAPDTPSGQRLLAHELTHVVQQSGLSENLLQRNPDECEGDFRETFVTVPWYWDSLRFYRELIPALARHPCFRGVREAAMWQPFRDPVMGFHARHRRRHPTGLEDRDLVSLTVTASLGNRGAVTSVRLESEEEERAALRRDDWNFTPAEFQALRGRGGAFRFARGSDWFPRELQQNLIATLNVIMDPATRPRATGGVNINDFFHGHVVMPQGAAEPGALRTARTEYRTERETRYASALGGEWYGDVTSQNLGAFSTAVEEVQTFGGRVLTEAVRAPGAAVIYHTYEYTFSVPSGSPRRNWITPLSSNTPRRFTPPDPRNASSAMHLYLYLFEFSFLVDSRGRIHVRPGGTRELSTVAGRPLRSPI